LLLIPVVAATLLASVEAAAAATDFSTPHRLAYCGVSEGEPPLHLVCWRPADGLTLNMTSGGRARGRLDRHNRGYHDPAVGRILRFGQAWTRTRRWACVSSSTGLTCSNASGHGWWLGLSRGSRVF
jgi:hypothetical protein